MCLAKELFKPFKMKIGRYEGTKKEDNGRFYDLNANFKRKVIKHLQRNTVIFKKLSFSGKSILDCCHSSKIRLFGKIILMIKRKSTENMVPFHRETGDGSHSVLHNNLESTEMKCCRKQQH